VRSAIAFACVPFFIKLLLLALGGDAAAGTAAGEDKVAAARDGDAGLASIPAAPFPSRLPPGEEEGSPPGGSQDGS